MKPLLYSVLIVFCLISCKGKEEKKGSGMLTVDNSGSLTFSSDSFHHKWDSVYALGSPSGVTLYRTDGIPAQGIVITNAGKPNPNWVKADEAKRLVKFIIDTIPKKDTLPIHWTSDSTQAYFLLEDTQSNYFSISDSTGYLAIRDNNTGKWEIIDCQRALEVVYMLDSLRISELKSKNKQ